MIFVPYVFLDIAYPELDFLGNCMFSRLRWHLNGSCHTSKPCEHPSPKWIVPTLVWWDYEPHSLSLSLRTINCLIGNRNNYLYWKSTAEASSQLSILEINSWSIFTIIYIENQQLKHLHILRELNTITRKKTKHQCWNKTPVQARPLSWCHKYYRASMWH